ncbi:trypsin-like serine protease [Brevibacterium otitidis]|uniref:Trypsin-like serine protease n=1 Tax=Brevibacterium otitidis TaxID=53364 RepID=A0ABV5WZH4_9MICO|nr:hypothetical protein GCM10023233_27810 [Brevibacterium otitidis]
MTKSNSLRALGLSAAIIVGAGGSLAASPAFAATPLDPASAQVAKDVEQMGAIGYGPGADGKLLVMVDASDKKAASALFAFDKKHTNVELIELKDGIKALSDRDVVGGAGYYSNNSGTAGQIQSGCSFGFPGWSPSGEEVVITAGHCHSTARGTFDHVGVTNPKTDKTGSVFNPTELHEGEMFGKFVYSQFGGKTDRYANEDDPTVTDIAVIKKSNDKYSLKPEVTDWTTQSDGDLSLSTTKITSVGTAEPKMKVKRSGRTTGMHEGEVLSKANFKFKVGDPVDENDTSPKVRWVTGFVATNHSDRGDSGGAWYNDKGEALGVLSAGGELTNGQRISLATDINHGLKQTGGYQVRLYVEAPKIDNVTVKPGETVSGTTAAGSKAEVAADSATKPEGFKVDGKQFSFTAPEKAGEYKYTFVAKKGEYNVSEPTTVTVTVKGDASPSPSPTATDDPTSTPSPTATDDPTSTPSPTATDDPTSTPSPTATEDPSDDPAERALSIDPENIKATDFVKKDAVQIAATGCTPGTEANLTVKPRGSNVTGHTDTATVDKDGNVAFSVYGENSDTPNAYIGDYDVTVACDGGDDLTGSFTVTKAGSKDDDGKGGGKNKDDDKKKLPRTGSEALGSLGAAAALIAGGAGLYVLARRRKN